MAGLDLSLLEKSSYSHMASIEAAKFRLKIMSNDIITGTTGHPRNEMVEATGADWR
ncbi:hypothetical protein ABCW43_18730 [Neorhizobium sp. IRAMC:178]|uniref:hypothetical protein n=1 Tax=Neorhizobium tunisiense TaxID=3144793 RepID=UPI0031F64CE7